MKWPLVCVSTVFSFCIEFLHHTMTSMCLSKLSESQQQVQREFSNSITMKKFSLDSPILISVFIIPVGLVKYHFILQILIMKLFTELSTSININILFLSGKNSHKLRVLSITGRMEILILFFLKMTENVYTRLYYKKIAILSSLSM